jgi:nucleoid-associated protein YgaU
VVGGLAIVAIAAAAVLQAGPGGVPAVAAGPVPAPSAHAGASAAPRVHVARQGDTLWAIAHRYRGAVSHDTYLEALIGSNGGTRIEVGQSVRLP